MEERVERVEAAVHCELRASHGKSISLAKASSARPWFDRSAEERPREAGHGLTLPLEAPNPTLTMV